MSIPLWEHSSVGRASALQAGGHRFEPYCSHHKGAKSASPFFGRISRSCAEASKGVAFKEKRAKHLCGNGSVVERCLAKANVASSNLVSRSKKKTAGLRPAVFFLERVLEGVRGKAMLCRRSHLSDSENPAEAPPRKHG